METFEVGDIVKTLGSDPIVGVVSDVDSGSYLIRVETICGEMVYEANEIITHATPNELMVYNGFPEVKHKPEEVKKGEITIEFDNERIKKYENVDVDTYSDTDTELYFVTDGVKVHVNLSYVRYWEMRIIGEDNKNERNDISR